MIITITIIIMIIMINMAFFSQHHQWLIGLMALNGRIRWAPGHWPVRKHVCACFIRVVPCAMYRRILEGLQTVHPNSSWKHYTASVYLPEPVSVTNCDKIKGPLHKIVLCWMIDMKGAAVMFPYLYQWNAHAPEILETASLREFIVSIT